MEGYFDHHLYLRVYYNYYGFWEVVVAQLVERLLPMSTVYWKDENKEKEAGNGQFLKKVTKYLASITIIWSHCTVVAIVSSAIGKFYLTLICLTSYCNQKRRKWKMIINWLHIVCLVINWHLLFVPGQKVAVSWTSTSRRTRRSTTHPVN